MFVQRQLTTAAVTAVVALGCWAGDAEARPPRPGQIPNGNVNSCANCHVNPGGGGTRNLFGQMIEDGFLTAASFEGMVLWGPELAALDADGDGATNGQELQDPAGDWRPGDPSPGDPAKVTMPWDPASKPTGAAILTLRLTDMNPHVGQSFHMRVVRSDDVEVARQVVESVDSPSFELTVGGLTVGESYRIDFYADLNQNGTYDPPPVDHAWRLRLSDVGGDVVLDFAHSPFFTDVAWPADAPTAVQARSWGLVKSGLQSVE